MRMVIYNIYFIIYAYFFFLKDVNANFQELISCEEYNIWFKEYMKNCDDH